ncbi:MAG: hypothetical protein IJ570_05985 [Prevotella sp.]|nr:hypothetical protein [Prevotella sp.]
MRHEMTKYQKNAKQLLRSLLLLAVMMVGGTTGAWAETTYKYYCLHVNNVGYMKQYKGIVGNENTFRYENAYDANGSSIWIFSPEVGYLQCEMYYLNVINNRTLVLSTTPITKWELVTDDGKSRFQMQGSSKVLGLDASKNIVLAESPANKYTACTLTVNEEGGKWEGPKDKDITVQSPQIVTFLRTYYLRNISVTIDQNDAGTKDVKVVDKKDSRSYCTRSYITSQVAPHGMGSDWNYDDDTKVIYNLTTSNQAVTANYDVEPVDPITKATHPATEVSCKTTITPKAFTPASDKKYLLFNTQADNYRFPKATTSLEENALLPVDGTKNELTEDVNGELCWVIEPDTMGYYSFKNVKTGRYLYYDATDFTVSDYGAVKIGATSLPDGDTRYKFRLFSGGVSRTPFSGCFYIIPFDKQFAVVKSDATLEELYFALYMNTSNSTKIASLTKASDPAKWKLYSYEWQYRLWNNHTINGDQNIYATGNYNYTTTTWFSRNIKDSPSNTEYCLQPNSKTNADITYEWTLTGLDDYVTVPDDVESGGTSTLTTTVTLPPGTRSGTLKVTAKITSPANLNNFISIPITLYNLNPTLTEISTLSEITDANGLYKLTADNDYSEENKPVISNFGGTLEAAIDPATHMPYRIKSLTAPLFETLTGTVRNLVVESTTISGHEGNTGVIACTANGLARIYNVGILGGSVGGTGYVGGLVGLLDDNARVVNCYSYADITAGTDKGGIVGYNNKASTQASLTTMVMNCMFYGDIAEGGNISPIYGGTEINNVHGGLPNYNYYRYNSPYSINGNVNKYNRSLAMQEKFINRFERYRLLLNSNRRQAAFYITASTDDPESKMAKWVIETADRTIENPLPYPILKVQGKYPSIINYDAEHTPDSITVGRGHGGRLGDKKLTVTISGVGTGAPDGASLINANGNLISTSLEISLNRTDKDFDRYNYNYDKVQLPYYNDVGTGNYTGNKVVTGWKITSINGGTEGTYNTADEWGGFNFADRDCTNKDLYGEGGSNRVFSQGAYFDVPNDVTGITIEPYWGTAAYVCDQYFDAVFNKDYGKQDVTLFGTQHDNNTDIDLYGDGNKQKVYTSIDNARKAMSIPTSGKTVYDYAVVLVGNVHQYGALSGDNTPYTIMSVDMNHDNEPDYSFIFSHNNRVAISPIRFDFINIPGISEAQMPNGASTFRNPSIFKPTGWFEITNTCIINFSQFEYDNGSKSLSPLILLGGTFEQFVSTQNSSPDHNTSYIHVGSNAWFAKFGNGTHSDGNKFTPHIPVSATGGDYDEFYLSGTYQPNIDAKSMKSDDAECYVSGGHFGEMAAASLEKIQGDVRWDINWADITSFYGGGVNANNPITGSIRVDIANSHVNQFCGGPKFGDMSAGKNVITNATSCTFGTFFGAGFGGNSFNRVKYRDEQNMNFSTRQSEFASDRGKYFDGATTNSPGGAGYGKKGKGVAVDFDYEFFTWSTGVTGGRFFTKFVSFSLATTGNVTSTLDGCHVTGNFYGGGSLGKVDGNATSELNNCKVDGSVFGAGFSASLPTIEVRKTPAFIANHEPKINSTIGMFEMGQPNETDEYQWKQVAITDLKNNDLGSESTSSGSFVWTDENLSQTNLGTVTGKVTLTLNSTTVGDNVYGGGDQSTVNNNDIPANAQTEVTLKGNTVVSGDVFGGGNRGLVSGSTTVNIKD